MRNEAGQFVEGNAEGFQPGNTHAEHPNAVATRFKKGEKPPYSHFKKGMTPWNKGRITGVVSDLRRAIRDSYPYQQWRLDVCKRDGYKCVKCGMAGKIEVDHYPKSFAEIMREHNITTLEAATNCPTLWNVSNGRVLCKNCHKEATKWQISKKDLRRFFIEFLIEKARQDPRIVFIIPDVGFSFIERYKDEFPGRFFNFGVTEQSSMVIAAGLALSGMKPYIYSMINFVVFRPYEMIRNAVACHNADVKIIGVQGSEKYAFLGFSHNQYDDEDLKVLEHLMACHVPESEEEAKQVFEETYESDLPAYIRI